MHTFIFAGLKEFTTGALALMFVPWRDGHARKPAGPSARRDPRGLVVPRFDRCRFLTWALYWLGYSKPPAQVSGIKMIRSKLDSPEDSTGSARLDFRGGLLSSGFLGLLVTQFLGAFNDNVYRC